MISDKVSEYLSTITNWIKQSPNNMVTITGHTEKSGTDSENLALGISRATKLREALIDLGAPFQQIDFSVTWS